MMPIRVRSIPYLLRLALDLLRIPQQDRRAQLHPVEAPRGLEHARLRAFGKDDPLGMTLQLLENGLDESHGPS